MFHLYLFTEISKFVWTFLYATAVHSIFWLVLANPINLCTYTHQNISFFFLCLLYHKVVIMFQREIETNCTMTLDLECEVQAGMDLGRIWEVEQWMVFFFPSLSFSHHPSCCLSASQIHCVKLPKWNDCVVFFISYYVKSFVCFCVYY